MLAAATTVEDYIANLSPERREAMIHLRKVIKANLPKGFDEVINYGMIGYVVPLSKFPAGYHADPKQPLPFINIAAQKNYIALYHMGLYGSKKLLEWFKQEYAKDCKTKLDMGKSCIRFKKAENIPFELIAELSRKITPEDWIRIYSNAKDRRTVEE